MRSSILTSGAHHEVKKPELEELNLGGQGKSLGDLGEADPANRISPVKFVSHTQVWETCVRRVKFEFPINPA
jgi:hypothetical protein